MAGNKPINKHLRGIRDSIPGGYVLGRTGGGSGPPILLPAGNFVTKGYVANTTIQVNGPAGGDLSGTYPNPTVAKINGNAVKAGTPSNNQVLTYITADTEWEPETPHYIPAGGSTGQVLEKNSGTDYDVSWDTPASGGGAASIQDTGSAILIALSDASGQLVLDGSGNPIFSNEVFPIASIPSLASLYDALGAAATVQALRISSSVFGLGKVDGTSIVASSGVISGQTPKILVATATEVDGPTTATPGDGVMVGAGSTYTFTPTITGKIKISGTFVFSITNVLASARARLRYGTGTPPSNGDAATGTVIVSNPFKATVAINGEQESVGYVFTISGLTLGTAYWLDYSTWSDNGGGGAGTIQVQTNYMVIEEVS